MADTFLLEDGEGIEPLKEDDYAQKSFEGYYFDGKATPETAKQIEKIMMSKDAH